MTQLGGFTQHPSGRTLWFSERLHHANSHVLTFPLMQTCRRTIQLSKLWHKSVWPGLLQLFTGISTRNLLEIVERQYWRLLALNLQATNKMFTTTKPMCYFVEILAPLAYPTFLATHTGTPLLMTGAAGHLNLRPLTNSPLTHVHQICFGCPFIMGTPACLFSLLEIQSQVSIGVDLAMLLFTDGIFMGGINHQCQS